MPLDNEILILIRQRLFIISKREPFMFAKLANDEAQCASVAFSSEVSRLANGSAGVSSPVDIADVESRRRKLNNREGILGMAGVSKASATSVATNQPTPVQG